MSKIPFLNHLDLRSVSELQNAILHKTTTTSASNVEGKLLYDTGTNTIQYYNGSGWISLTGDTNTFRPVQADGSAIGSTETLNLIGGTNITLSENAGAITINGAAAMAFVLEDTDGTEITINNGKEVKFLGDGISTNWTDTNAGTDGDPYDLTITNTDKGSAQNIFKTIAINPSYSGTLTYAGQRNLVADSNSDTLRIFDGTGIDITGASQDDVMKISIADGGVDTTQLAADAVDGTKIADDAVDSEHIAAGAIDTDHVGDDQITYAKIQNVSATNRILGRDSSGAGIIEEITPADVLTMLGSPNNYSLDFAKLNAVTSAMDENDDLVFGDSGDDTQVTIKGNLTVTGTQTVNNVVTVSTSNGVQFEGTAADGHDATLLSVVASSDKTYTLPNITGHIPILTNDPGTTAITATAAELNLIDGGATIGTSGVAKTDGFFHNDNGVAKITRIDKLTALFAGSGLTASNGQLVVGSAQTGITSIYNGSLRVGRSSSNARVDFATNNEIRLITNSDGQGGVTVTQSAIKPNANNGLDVGTSSMQFKDGYFHGTLEADAITVNGTALNSVIDGRITNKEYKANFPASATSAGDTITITHSLNTRDVVVQFYANVADITGSGSGDVTQYEEVKLNNTRATADTITVVPLVPLAASALRVLIKEL